MLLLFALTSVSAQTGGLNVLSMSKVDYSWSGEVQGDAWILHITQSSEGERIQAIINKEDIKGKISGEQGFATHDIEISMNPITTACNYRIEPKSDSIYTAYVYAVEQEYLKYNWYGEKLDEYGWYSKCTADGDDFRKNEGRLFGPDTVLACFYTTDMGSHGELQTPTFDFTTEVSVTKRGTTQETINTVIGNHEKAAYLGQCGHIEWVGSLSSGEYCPMRDLPDAVYNPSTGWVLIDDYGYEQYSNYYPTQWEACKLDFETYNAQDSAAAISRAQSCANSLNDVAGKALAPKTITAPIVVNTNIDGAMAKANIKSNAIMYPTYKLILSASWLGIYVPKPEPTIANKESEWDISTSRGKFRADIKNVGDEGGDFTYGVTCQYPAQAVEPERSGHWNKGETKTVEFLITGSVTEETITTCTLHVYATKFPDIRKEEAVQITVEPLPTPTPKPTSITTPISTLPGAIIPTSPPVNGDGTPFRNMLLYTLLGLLFTGVIAAVLLWRRGGRGTGTEASESSESDESKQDTEKKRPNSSSAKWLATIIILIVILGGSGVFILSSLKTPEVSVESVSIKGFESIDLIIVAVPTEAIFSVVLEVYNPNFLGATVTDVEYDLYVNGVHIGKGLLPHPVSIHANDRTNVETEISVSLFSSIQAVVTAVQQKSATAKVVGDVYIKVPVKGAIRVPFSEEQKIV